MKLMSCKLTLSSYCIGLLCLLWIVRSAINISGTKGHRDIQKQFSLTERTYVKLTHFRVMIANAVRSVETEIMKKLNETELLKM
jgi:hypothetical protein